MRLIVCDVTNSYVSVVAALLVVAATCARCLAASADCVRCQAECANAYRNPLSAQLCSRCVANSCNQSEIANFFQNHRCCALDHADKTRFAADGGRFLAPQHQPEQCSRPTPDLGQCLQMLVAESMDGGLQEAAVQRPLSINVRPTFRRTSQVDDRFLHAYLPRHRGRFVNMTRLRHLQEELDTADRQPHTRTQGIRLCQIRRKVAQPVMATHHSGVLVFLLSSASMKQYFFIASCSSRSAQIPTDPRSECRDVDTMHKALFVINDVAYRNFGSKMSGCERLESSPPLWLCDDWIRLKGHCALYVSLD